MFHSKFPTICSYVIPCPTKDSISLTEINLETAIESIVINTYGDKNLCWSNDSKFIFWEQQEDAYHITKHFCSQATAISHTNLWLVTFYFWNQQPLLPLYCKLQFC